MGDALSSKSSCRTASSAKSSGRDASGICITSFVKASRASTVFPAFRYDAAIKAAAFRATLTVFESVNVFALFAAAWKSPLSKKLSLSLSVAASTRRLEGAVATSCCKRSRSSTRSPVARASLASRHRAYCLSRESFAAIV